MEYLRSGNPQPDIVLLDLDMDKMGGEAVLRLLRVEFPNIKVIILSLHDEPPIKDRLLHQGAWEYLIKDCDPKDLESTIKIIFKKNSILEDSNGYNSEKINSNIRTKEKKEKLDFCDKPLTIKEIEVLKLMYEEKTKEEISTELDMKGSTVDFHKTNLKFKTGTKNDIGLIKYAILHGIVK
jgi:DNA-binding NarL/FixJ family response regulator